MTGFNFVSFLFSLLLVDIHYTMRRQSTAATTSSSPGSLLPSWLHQLLHPTEPYEASPIGQGPGGRGGRGGRGYYHSHQKKLFRMEAEDAFRLRNRTLVVLGGLAMGAMGLVWYLAGRAYRRWLPAKLQ